jgi:NADPH-dependent 2,4-dienoyl-CoA reductase/sulfur reductase-like enzyme
MKDYNYIIVGGGMAAGSAVAGIRELDHIGTVLMISEENALPYNRPPLSKKLWAGGSESEIYLEMDEQGLDILLDTSVLSINPDLRRIAVSSGETFSYEKLLLATGGRVRELPFGKGLINYYRTIADYHHLRSIAEEKDRVTVIGAGFIGAEIAAALATTGKQVTMIDVGPGVGWRIFPAEMVHFLNDYYHAKGVTVLPDVELLSVVQEGGQIELNIKGNTPVLADGVVAGVGIVLNDDLAQDSGLALKNGIQVNETLQTSDPGIFAAGDIANFYNPTLARRIRVEHADNAKAMGRQAGRNMAEANEPYSYLPLFYSDMFELGYEAVGILDSRLKIIEDWQEKFVKGVLYYLEDDEVVGALLWNVWDQADAVRAVIGNKKSYSEKNLIGLIR